MRQALGGMLWTKQYFYYDLDLWLDEHGAGAHLPAHERKQVRNSAWPHMYNNDIISMPDKREYPWFAAWDLAFHMIPLGMATRTSPEQLVLMLQRLPASERPAAGYEWNFGDELPVHAGDQQLYLFDKSGGRQGGHRVPTRSRRLVTTCG
jgi:hypothetical protein